MKLLIKGMVCDRCIYVLSEELPKIGLEISDIRLGEVILKETGTIEEQAIRAMLQKNGFDLLYCKNQKIIDQIKSAVEKGIHEQLDTGESVKFSTLISNELHKDYDSLSSLFSSLEGYTLENFSGATDMMALNSGFQTAFFAAAVVCAIAVFIAAFSVKTLKQ